MPGLVRGRKRTLTPDNADEDDSSSPEYEEPLASKRVKTNGHLSNGPVLPASYRSDHSGTTNGNGTSSPLSHQPGSIVRVALRDFVTYTSAEFHLGPSLNMIIGPNGTGKSTLVCAICLGLGGHTSNLGRAKDYSEFVKHGAAEGSVEIELAADPARHRANPVIKMVIKKSNNKASYYLNGRSVPRSHVVEECKAFNIQVDNLCQFLPQDRVVEFAALQPVDLLTETLRAIASPEIITQHEELKTHDAKLKHIVKEVADLSSSLKGLEEKHNRQRPDVERAQQRTQLLEKAHALELYRPTLQYGIARQRFEDVRARKVAATQEYEQLKLEVEPALRAVNEKQAYSKKVEEAVQQRARVYKAAIEKTNRASQKQTELCEKIAAATKEIEAEADREKGLKQELARLNARVRDIESKMRENRPEFDAADYNERLRAFTRDMRDLEDRAGEANSQQDSCKQQIAERASRMKDLERDLQALHSHAGQQEGKLRKASMDTFKAWQWIQDNMDKFQGPVFGPPIISCSVKDKRHALFVESVMTGSDFLSITATTPADFKLLSDKLTGDMRLSDVYLRTSSIGLARYKSPMPKEQLAELGLDCYLLDLLEGPDAVLAMLCDNRNIQQTAVAFKNLSSEQYNAVTRSSISSFVTPTETFTITRRREYGDRGTSTRARKVRQPQFFGDQQVDTGAEREINDQIRELKGDIEELKKVGSEHQETSRNLGQRHKEIEAAKNELQEEKDSRQKALQIYNSLPTQLQTAGEKLDATRSKIQGTFDTRQEIQARINEDNKEKGRNAVMYATSGHALVKMYTDVIKAEIQQIEANSEVENLQARNAEVRKLLEERQREVQDLREKQAQARQEAAALLNRVNEIQADLSDGEREIHHQQPNDLSLEDLEGQIVALQAQLEMIHEGNPHIVREFEERERMIEKKRENYNRIAGQLESLKQQMQEIREQWEGPFDALIRQVSEAFGDNMSRINCAGHVEVEKKDDLAEWALDIMVKFRENEQLSQLDSHRQSGGERAVSTIFYLMALQSLARAPFRVVDEINQGMDPRNERLIHSRMVSVACAENTSQYFLITPKLLPNLQYHPNMKVQCIASGEYLPGDGEQLHFRALATKALEAHRRRTLGRV
ncbi:structural maintenance of chromosomes 5 smc5 [Myriangium duriaei CBS 260.36]|uniref:Structural maintenance of chromosomes protein 5 n=1 Tax=Myriangium duriaei CBS 260.36 TaxID=1168546 RepID=A0A9P4IU01_9PEZI|nr:structural maintenance of chromosomes 5 smc5 [Myriangium duriaei CBS 260.36]